MSCKYITFFFCQISFLILSELFFIFSYLSGFRIYGKGFDHRFLRLHYHWHIELYNWSCPLDVSLSFFQILNWNSFSSSISYFWNFVFPFQMIFFFTLFPFSSEINFEFLFLLEIENFVFGNIFSLGKFLFH